jgi:predicted phage terminase large subunit-like protein
LTNSAQRPRSRKTKQENLRRHINRSLEIWARYVLQPSGQLPALHHQRILKALESVSSGETQRLILLLPPGSAKSTYASRIFPAWWLGQHPASAVIAASHTATLSEHFGRGVRDLVAEKGAVLGLTLRQDVRAAGNFETVDGSQYFAVGVQGAVTGRRADLALVDDPIRSLNDAESFSAREHLWEWFRSELVTRMKPGGRIVLIMTRWHSDDLAGRLIERGGWDVLRFPAFAEADDPLGRQVGGALWPAWENEDALLEKKALLGERHFSALFQQAPLREAGQLFDPRKVRIVDVVPRGTCVRAWDLAASLGDAGNPDWTVGVKLVRDETGQIFVDDVIRFRALAADVAARIHDAAQHDGREVTIGLPQDPGQAGKAQILYLTQLLAGYRVVASPESGNKATRAMPIASQISAGSVAMRRACWNGEFLDEIANFPNGAKDDQVDALARAFEMIIAKSPQATFRHLPFLTR